MYKCQTQTCRRLFATPHACNQHMNALDHFAPQYECDACTAQFWNEEDRDEHMDDYGHYRWRCESQTCSRLFTNSRAAEQHMEAVRHFKNYCVTCKKRFSSANNLKMHENSGVHQGFKMSCPFCNKAFVSATGLTHHLETGSCPNASNVNRETIWRAVRQRDPNGVFTKNLLEWHGETTVTEYAWNGDGYECYICHRVWAQLHGLKMHVNSDAHKQEIYHCPNKARCGKSFKNLAGMFNHLESESCGYIKFAGVQQQVGNILTGNRLITI